MAISSDKYLKSHDTLDWDALRLQSLAPGGFGSARTLLWPSLLHVDANPTQPSLSTEDQTEPDPHRDERQIRLDTDRSFVLYPLLSHPLTNLADDGPEDVRLARQAELNHLIVQTFRRHPGLNYFQGFHDIATVLQLTLPPKIALPALEKLSLHRLRDSMGHTLEPLTSLMLILQRLLRLVDLPYAMLLEDALTREGQHRHAPLPYAALPHLLTLFAHATPSLPLIQHIFDYLLVRPPLAIVYLVAAVSNIIRKDLVLKLGEGGDGDEGMIHSVLTGLPEFTDYGEDQDNGEGYEVQLSPEFPPQPQNAPITPLCLWAQAMPCLRARVLRMYATPPQRQNYASALHLLTPLPDLFPVLILWMALRQRKQRLVHLALSRIHLHPAMKARQVYPSLVTPLSHRPQTPLPPSTLQTSHFHLREPPHAPRLPSAQEQGLFSLAHLSLPKVFLLADELFARFPPSTPELRLSHTIGPASAMQTWAQDVALMPSDDQAEALVVAGTDIVVREAPTPDSQNRKELQKRVKKRGIKKARKGEARLLVAGAVLVLGVAVAYGVGGRRGGGGIGIGGEAIGVRCLVRWALSGRECWGCLVMHSSDCEYCL
ncbi:rab-GTPase-TBC domain-containing protein [Multifurca ochricompacta]|uniref:Rab-GTPase-TBC domain-containing protein n=1 Tax=Multifurca ochricompacta TaxID=376703 RepID=A0AAD4M264_9AGAM|nr:rab-GTPase-TBC domain-containing protein [Multifurca ochricompacta]